MKQDFIVTYYDQRNSVFDTLVLVNCAYDKAVELAEKHCDEQSDLFSVKLHWVMNEYESED